jgi:hypothetical protein
MDDLVERACAALSLPAGRITSEWGKDQASRHFRAVGLLNPRLFIDHFQLEFSVYCLDVSDQLPAFWTTFGNDLPEIRDIYQVLGQHDVVLTALGTNQELTALEGTFARSGYSALRLRVAEVLRLRGYDVPQFALRGDQISPDLAQAANTAASEYLRAIAQTGVRELVTRMERSSVLLGPAVIEDVEWTGRFLAWVALRFSARVLREQRDLFARNLLTNSAFSPNIWTAFRLQPDESENFSYLLLLACDTFSELDNATDQIIESGIGLETLTLPITKTLERPWLIRATGTNPLSPGLARIWFRLNPAQKTKVINGEVPTAVLSLLDDALIGIYVRSAEQEANTPADLQATIDRLSSRFARAAIDGDIEQLKSIHTEVMLLVEPAVRSAAQSLAKRYYGGSEKSMIDELGVTESMIAGWQFYQTLLDQWITMKSSGTDNVLVRWPNVRQLLEQLRPLRNRQVHQLGARTEAKLAGMVFDVGRVMEDTITCLRWFAALESRAPAAESKRKMVKRRVFLSYRSTWAECTDRVREALLKFDGGSSFEVFLDRVDLGPGLLLKQLENGLAWCDLFMPVITKDYFDGPIASREADLAIRRAAFERSIDVIPLIAEGDVGDYTGFVTGYVAQRLDCSADEPVFAARMNEICAFALRSRFGE